MEMAGEFDGKVALVTGAGSGLGREVAVHFARRGAKLIVGDISEEGGQETVRLVKEAGGEAFFVRADVSSAADSEAMVNRALEQFGRLDFANNNAGIEGDLAPTGEYTEEAWNRVIAINLTGVFLGMRYQIPAMLRTGGGTIVNTASILGLVGFANAPAYTASKHGVVGLTKAAALEYATQGIRINAVCPGFVETPMVMERGVQAGQDPEAYQQIADLHPMGRLARPEEIATTIMWLCSEGSSFVTGAAIPVGGGYIAR
jgi:NAD(P)-dependent dehydrogenase (short-subunit alcohol dehydrogenase family)